MLHQLSFEVSFAHTGKTLKGSHTFSTGLTAITGPNESGKSLRTEMIRYALFGVPALRSKASTYEKISVSLSFQIGDVMYKLERTKANATLYVNDQVNCKGTTPVNKYVLDLLGYDLAVFDIANACLQGEVEALSRMTPTERKGMVDRVIGLDTIDDLIKEVNTEMSGKRMLVDSLEKRIVQAYEKPEIPEAWRRRDLTVEQLENEVRQTQLLVTEKHGLEQQLFALNCDQPPPVETTVKTPLFELYDKKNRIKQDMFSITTKESNLAAIQKRKEDFKPTYSEKDYQEYLDEGKATLFERYEVYEKQLTRFSEGLKDVPLPAVLNNLSWAAKYKDVVKQIDDLKSSSHTTCPLCSGSFCLSQDQIDKLQSVLPHDFDRTWIKDLEESRYAQNLNWLAADIQLQNEYEVFKSSPSLTKPLGPYLGTEIEVKSILEQFKIQGLLDREIESLKAELVEIKSTYPSLSSPQGELELVEAKIQTKLAEEEAETLYKTKAAQWIKFQEFKEKNEPRLMELVDVDKILAGVQSELQACREYQTLLHDYMMKSAENDHRKDELAVVKTELEELTKVRKALSELKPRVKVYLVPSLNRVASNLLCQMTNGQRNFIQVDENFDIMVDGQPIDTLSGSAKAVANLAIRIGLGTVLTNKIFSVLIADEVDAAMDKERAAYTAQCLRNLTATFKQIILVSHQKPEADHQIEL